MGLISNGTTIFDAGVFAAGLGGSMTFIKKLTASSSATLQFIDGSSNVVLDSTYSEYVFIWNNIHPGTDAASFSFQGNAAGGSGFDETITSTFFRARHKENGTEAEFNYDTGYQLSESTNHQTLSYATGSDNDQSTSGFLHLFNPSSTTFATHFQSHVFNCGRNDHARHEIIGGYFNTTAAIDEIQFKFHTGNIDSGTVSLYGIS